MLQDIVIYLSHLFKKKINFENYNDRIQKKYKIFQIYNFELPIISQPEEMNKVPIKKKKCRELKSNVKHKIYIMFTILV